MIPQLTKILLINSTVGRQLKNKVPNINIPKIDFVRHSMCLVKLYELEVFIFLNYLHNKSSSIYFLTLLVVGTLSATPYSNWRRLL